MQLRALHSVSDVDGTSSQVIDPDIPSSGLNINGEKIQAPSDEVLELRDTSSSSTFLVRFFDGRRTW